MQGILNFEFRILNSTALPKANSQIPGMLFGDDGPLPTGNVFALFP